MNVELVPLKDKQVEEVDAKEEKKQGKDEAHVTISLTKKINFPVSRAPPLPYSVSFFFSSSV
jgi:hypothetical protein